MNTRHNSLQGGVDMKNLRTPHTACSLILATCLFGLIAASCGDTPGTETESAPPPTATPAETPATTADPVPPSDQQQEPATQPIGQFSTEPYRSENWPEYDQTHGIYPVAVRSAMHDGFERIVIDHAGTGIPSMLAQYTEEPLAPGSGLPVDIHQDAVIEIIWSGTASIDDIDQDEMMTVNEPIINLNTHHALSVVAYAPWEATSSYFIGVDEQRPFAVTILQDPVRLVVDIQTD